MKWMNCLMWWFQNWPLNFKTSLWLTLSPKSHQLSMRLPNKKNKLSKLPFKKPFLFLSKSSSIWPFYWNFISRTSQTTQSSRRSRKTSGNSARPLCSCSPKWACLYGSRKIRKDPILGKSISKNSMNFSILQFISQTSTMALSIPKWSLNCCLPANKFYINILTQL